MRKIPSLRDIQFEQQLDYPTIEVDIDREKAGLSGATVEDVAHSLVMATSSTRFTNLNYWIDPKTGFDYLVQLQIPPLRLDKAEDVENLPLEKVNPLVNLMIRDVATVRRGVRPGEIDRDMSQRYLTLVANVEGEDMGLGLAPRRPGDRGRGRRPAPGRAGRDRWASSRRWIEMFRALGIGLAAAVFVIFILLTAYFQSPRLALISIGACAGGDRGDRDHPLSHRHLAQHRVVHGLDHVPGRLGLELGHAGDVHGRTLEGGDATVGRGGHHRRQRAAPADPDDRLRDDASAWCRWPWPWSGAARCRPRWAGR